MTLVSLMSITPLAFFFTTWWSALAVAGAAASVPIIIHLLNRKRFRIVTWAAMRFLLAAQRQNRRRMRLEQILLLAVRTLLVLLVVLAMASVMPWAEAFWSWIGLDGGAAPAAHAGRTHKILVLDGSFSMALKKKGEDKTAFDRARDRAVAIIKGSPRGDSFSVLLMAGPAPRRVGTKPSPKKDSVIDALVKLPGHPHGNADVPATLLAVEQILGESAGRFTATEVYFISDLQRTTWLPGLSRETVEEPARKKGEPGEGPTANPLRHLQDRALKVFVDVGHDDVDNLAVTDLRLEVPFVITGFRMPISATVKNYGSRDRHGAWAELLVSKAGQTPAGKDFPRLDPHPAERQPFDLNRDEQVTLNFDYRFKEPGEYAVQVRLQPDDLSVDDSRAMIVTVKKSIKVLLVNGKPDRETFEGSADYLRKAFNPNDEGQLADLPVLSRVEPRVVTEAEFADLDERDLEQYDGIFFCDVARPDQTEVRRLKFHLRRGGGVVFGLGPQTAGHLDRYNRLLYQDGKGILPARLVQVQKAPADHFFGFDLGKADFRVPPLLAFDSDDGRLLLRMVPFQQYVRAEVPPKLSVRTILAFLPKVGAAGKTLDKSLPADDPAILLWQPVQVPDKKEAEGEKKPAAPVLYRGRVALVTTSLNTDWTVWPKLGSYLPLMQELLRLAIAGRLREQSAVVGDALEEYLLAVGQKDARVHTPDRKTHDARTQLTEEASVFRWTNTDASGLYRVTIGADPQEHLFAVNVPATVPGQRASESDFTKPRCDVALLKSAYPGWRLQVVTDPGKVDRSLAAGPEETTSVVEPAPGKGKNGPFIAWCLLLAVLVLLLVEVVLAWHFGHYSAAGAAGSPPASGRVLPTVVGVVAFVVFAGMAYVLVDAAVTGDFLGFLPDGMHRFLEDQLGIPPARDGESNAWKLDFLTFGYDAEDYPWLAGGLALAALALVLWFYLREGRTAGRAYKLLLAGLRIFLILLTLAVLIPELQVRFERRDWPDLVIFLDTSGSMGEGDEYQAEDVRKTADRLAEKMKKDLGARLPGKLTALTGQIDAVGKELQKLAKSDDAAAEKRRQALRDQARDLSARRQYFQSLKDALNRGTWRPGRLQLATALLTLAEPDWFTSLLGRQKMKVYVYQFDRAGQAVPVGDLTGLHEIDRHKELIEKVKELRAEARVSPLDRAVRKILGDFSTSSLGAVVMLTDGITVPGRDSATDGKDADPLVLAAESAGARGVPLFLVGIGDAHGLRDTRLLSMDGPDVVHVKDHIEFKVTLRGHKKVTVPLKLYEKMKDGTLVELPPTKMVKIDPKQPEVTVRLRHQPKEAGEKVYVVRLELPKALQPKNQPREDQLQLQRKVLVEEARLVKVLYIEGTPRYEYRYIKTLLERESAEDKTNKTVDLKVVLLDADEGYAKEDKSALAELPPNRQELFQYDVILFGDVDPANPAIKDRFKDLVDFVRERGGGFLMIAGPNFGPNAYKDTPLQAILPVEITDGQAVEEDDISTGYRPSLTLEGQGHPIFRLNEDEGENLNVWSKLSEMFWYAKGYRIKPAARVLAVHPEAPPVAGKGAGGPKKHPLVVYQLVGAGRSMFFGFDETWRWRYQDGEVYFNRFWKNTVDYLSHRRPDRVELRLNKQTPYTRGELIKVTVRFPENDQAPDKVKVTWKRTPAARDGLPPQAGHSETMKLARADESVAVYEGRVSRTREGKYSFELASPGVKTGPVPTAEALVIPPEQELEQLSMNERGLRKAAQVSGGRYFTLADAAGLPDQLPKGGRVLMDSSRPPSLLWNQPALFLLILFLLGSEWILRKRKHLL